METSFTVWENNLPEEIAFWKEWLNNDKSINKERIELINKSFPYSYLFNKSSNSTLKVLDVGSGPVTTLGTLIPEGTIELTACDPLAEEYNSMLRAIGLAQRANIQKVAGEDLSKVFEKNSFDLVHSANALDHSYDPLLCIQNMLEVCKPGGWVVIIIIENEGERENYHGLHQWNFSLSKPDQVSLYSKNKNDTIIVNDHLKGVEQFKAYPVDHGSNLPIIQIDIQKST
jgi:SAM-dependent methyltransferase